MLRKVWSGWRNPLILVTPRTVTWLAWCRLSAALEMALKSQPEGRPKTCEQRDSDLDLSYGCQESDLGSAAYSRRSWVGSCRRDLLDHVIVLNERHLKQLMSGYVSYYHKDRTHLGLEKDTPAGRPIAVCSGAESEIQSLPRSVGCTIAKQRRRRLKSCSADDQAVSLYQEPRHSLCPVHVLWGGATPADS